jgi:hypothetical protein
VVASVLPAWAVKPGNAVREYEDAHYPGEARVYERDAVHVSVSDGATKAWNSGQWARMLSAAYGRSGGAPLAAIVKRASLAWEHWLPRYLDQRERRGNPLQWFEERGLARGPAATTLGLTLSDGGGSQTWQAVAVGDCNLFQVRDQAVVTAWPYEHAACLPFVPNFVTPRDIEEVDLEPKVLRADGTWQPGDELYLMTDALAKWFLTGVARDQAPWETLARVGRTHDAFLAWTDAEWTAAGLEEDDVTFVGVRLLPRSQP